MSITRICGGLNAIGITMVRPGVEEEEAGLDEIDHGDAGYHEGEAGGHGRLPHVALPSLQPAAAPMMEMSEASG